MTSINILELQEALYAMETQSPKDNERNLLRLRDTVAVMQRELRQFAEVLEQATIAHIDMHGDISISDTERLYVGTTKTNKALGDGQGITMAVLEAGGGNLELFTSGEGGLLASQPWKYGAVKRLVGESKAAELFITEERQDIKTGKAQRSVKTFDSRFST